MTQLKMHKMIWKFSRDTRPLLRSFQYMLESLRRLVSIRPDLMFVVM